MTRVSPHPPPTDARRDRSPERMDRPGLDPAAHAAALRGLARLNRLSRSAESLWPVVRSLARGHGGRLRVLDAATGGADVPIRLSLRARRAGFALEVTACDQSLTALDFAAASAKRRQVSLHLLKADVIQAPPPGDYDAAFCSLFLHHLGDAEAVTLFKHLATAAPKVVVNDLARGPVSQAIVWLATRLVSRSPVVHHDGPLSVRAAFTPTEAAELAERAGLRVTSVVRRHPCRYLLQAERR